jgi:prevent-host-death family protein
MRTADIHEAKTRFSRLIDGAASGEEIIIFRDGKPAARLAPMERAESHAAIGWPEGQGPHCG